MTQDNFPGDILPPRTKWNTINNTPPPPQHTHTQMSVLSSLFCMRYMVVKFSVIARAMMYFGLPENVLMTEIYVACVGFKDED